MPGLARAPRPPCARMPPAQIWRAERLTEITSGAKPAWRHAAPWAQAVRSTHSPIGTMRPVSSASGMKRSGRISPRCGWFQRTSASTRVDRAGAQVHARLVVQQQLVALDGAAQALLHREPLVGELVHLGGEELEGVAPLGLRAVHRGVGVLQQRLHVGPVLRIEADARAAGDVQLALADHDGLAHPADDAAHGAEDHVLARLVVQDQHELVAARCAPRCRRRAPPTAAARPRGAGPRRRSCGPGCR